MEEEKITASGCKTESEKRLKQQKNKKSFKTWWKAHKPSKRRLIQVYAALLYNANVKGFITGKIFTGTTKFLCVPGMNCYSCPGAVGACPLGSLQNALASTNRKALYYMLGIILLYGLILGRTICGYLCPVGLGQDLLYKIRTPKIKKNKFTQIFSYLKYVLLAVFVLGITLAFTGTPVPAFCKYICPAGTFGGALLLLIHPDNAYMYEMLGPLFTWKFIVFVVIFVLSIFIYRAFCRFFCPLGAIYGIFNRFALLGIKVNRDKCIDCGKCVKHCKMDIKRVGDHECINCGDCVGVCPTKAISYKGGKYFINNSVDESLAVMETEAVTLQTSAEDKKNKKPSKTGLLIKIVSITLAAALFVGVFAYVNFFADGKHEYSYDIVVKNPEGNNGLVQFKIGNSDKEIIPDSGNGSLDDPYIITSVEGLYSVYFSGGMTEMHYLYKATKKGEYAFTALKGNVIVYVYYVVSGTQYACFDYSKDTSVNITLEMPDGYGNTVGFICPDFTLKTNLDETSVSLSDLRGKIVIINFWATWCGPCVAELPHFEEVRKNYENVEVLALHSANITEDVKSFLLTKDWQTWGVKFLQDGGTKEESEVYTLLGGLNSSYPRTVIVDENGVIRYIFPKSITYQTLNSAVESLKKQ